MPTKTTTIIVANLATLEKYADKFEIECWTIPTTGVRVLGPYFCRAVPSTGAVSGGASGYVQSAPLMFPGLTLGTTYYFRTRVHPVAGGTPSPWSGNAAPGSATGWVTETAGDLTAPNPTYSPKAVINTAGLYVVGNPSSAALDLAFYEVYVAINNPATPAASATPTFSKLQFPNFDAVCDNIDTVYAWARAVDTSGNQQAWTSLGTYTNLSIVGDAVFENGNFEASSSILPPPGYETYIDTGTQLYDASAPFSGSRSLRLLQPSGHSGGVRPSKKLYCRPGDTIYVSCRTKQYGGQRPPRVSISFRDQAGSGTPGGVDFLGPATTGWTQVSGSAVAGAGTVMCTFELYTYLGDGASGDVGFDEHYIRAVRNLDFEVAEGTVFKKFELIERQRTVGPLNLVQNGGFERGDARNWSQGTTEREWLPNVDANQSGAVGSVTADSLSAEGGYRATISGVNALTLTDFLVSVNSARRYLVEARVKNGGGGANDTMYIGFACFDQNKTFIRNIGGATFNYNAAVNLVQPSGFTVYSAVTIPGEEAANPGDNPRFSQLNQMHVGTKYISPLILANRNDVHAGSGNTLLLDYFKIVEISSVAENHPRLSTLDNSGFLDFAPTHRNKILDNILDGSTYARVTTTPASGLNSGTAVDGSGNLLLKNVENSSGSTNQPTTSSTTYAVVPEMTQTITTKGNKVLVVFTVPLSTSDFHTGANIAIFRDATQISSDYLMTWADASVWTSMGVSFIDSPSAASHTYDVRWKITAGPGFIGASGIARTLQVVELG